MTTITTNKLLKFSTLKHWLEQQPPKKTYDWGSVNGDCLFSHYMNAHGFNGNPQSSADSYTIWLKLHDRYPGVMIDYCTQESYNATYGAALDRAVKLYAWQRS
jgi:hypothetical protein